MTEVAFHFNVPDKLGYACRLLRKAAGSGAKVVVTGEADLLRALDTELWTFSALEFLPHCHAASADAQVLAASPIVLADAPRATPHQEVLVNLGTRVPDGFERFERLIEVVTQDDEDRQQARTRWKHYADRGYAIKRHDLAAKEGT
ncbi:DNA polymerase III subunit chi [Ramlibacter montanisoli]|uniref:DNA polymerase III subunit chi n=1 Tax=Ramlibacter montanisoli TaxID=2732512 RepID=A0A849KMH0_9BURK|nr:DNA polymerase III subunit chi [Ramlibacter montanisoli]NNU42969.1 DNA polymerase III subunit chi [Ramlibacter montanisoli]